MRDRPTIVTPVKLTVVPTAKVTFALKVTAVLKLTAAFIVTGTLIVRWLVNGKDGSILMVVFPVNVMLFSV